MAREIKRKKKIRAQMPVFGWIFALIIGAVILFFAIFFIIKYSGQESYKTSTELAQKIDVILNPFSSLGKGTTVADTIDTKKSILFLDCSTDGEFGYSVLKALAKLGIGKEEISSENKIYNKYIFGNENLKGKILIFSRSIEIPFRIDDAVMLSEKKFCFVNAPKKISEEISQLNIDEIKNVSSKDDCDKNSVKVCFDNNNCDINVKCENPNDEECNYGYVRKQKKFYFFTDTLMYASIFSSYDIYNCNVKRIMKRLQLVNVIFQNKAQHLGCVDNNVLTKLSQLSSYSSEVINGNLKNNYQYLYETIQALENANKWSTCQLF